MTRPDYPKYIPLEMGSHDRYDLKRTDETTWHVRNDGILIGTIKRDDSGYFKPGSDARHLDFDETVRLTIRGTLR